MDAIEIYKAIEKELTQDYVNIMNSVKPNKGASNNAIIRALLERAKTKFPIVKDDELEDYNEFLRA